MQIAVVGGGINGLCSAWQLALAGHQVTLFERDQLMQATSVASSKLLHGGLRYLEQGEFRLVREALQERRWWLKKAPQLTRRLPILYPLYQHSQRARWQLKIGLWLYDSFAGKKGIGRHRWLTAVQTLRCSPQLKAEGLLGAYLFFDGQMDDQKLGLWMAEQCRKAGVNIVEHSPVLKIQPDGELQLTGGKLKFASIINVAGPWSSALLQQSGLMAAPLDLVRGSHLLLPAISRYGHMLEVPGERRIVFALPYQQQCLLGTTEVRQPLDDPVQCSPAERDYLLGVYAHYFTPAATPEQLLGSFAGVRPLLAGSADASRASREYQFSWQGKILTVSGGKWTTARALGQQLAAEVNRQF
ncbi:glycerol-3-phosphate dehydrogenase/oxidase [Alishewanella sp. HH-ZS]|uniref:glycerol-3-phosphate dehydrogenase/oxidase n=1 Tax=Alishewanella sp. HH-ZS TaxID=1856684 RepID=UPI0008235A39|nr:glycerol-3-phosphate dehydrogenase/oxidase [Alishewanella sp. HH-ZS]OCW96189.1 FAD-dependent oxidoreductase [Alishewanella sp. HH-ZS]